MGISMYMFNDGSIGKIDSTVEECVSYNWKKILVVNWRNRIWPVFW